MDKLIEEVEKIIIKFTDDEVGNRLSAFSMLALKEIVLNKMKMYKTENEKPQVDKGNKPKAGK